jgi:prolipoprotein diacylglyceryltransferase
MYVCMYVCMYAIKRLFLDIERPRPFHLFPFAVCFIGDQDIIAVLVK